MDPERDVTAGFRLSPQQRRLWHLHGGTVGPYRAWCAARIEGGLDAARLRGALEAVVARHEILRTLYRCRRGMTMPLQVVAPELPPELELRDLAVAPDGEEAAVDAVLAELARRPFDLERGPLLRALLARTGPERWWLALELPALAADRAGVLNLLRELAASYDAGPPGGEEAEEAAQYADLAEWQNELLEAADGERERVLWRSREGPAGSAARLPCERRVQADEPPYASLVVPVVLPDGAAAALDAAAGRYEVPVGALLLAAWRLLLSRLAGSYEVAVGVACDGRSYEGLEGALGRFARVLPLAPRAEPGWAFPKLLRQLAQALAEAQGVQEYFDPALHGTEGASRLASFGFELHAPPPRLAIGGAPVTVRHLGSRAERFTAQLSCTWGAGERRIELELDAARIDAVEARRLASQLATVLSGLAASLERTASEIEVRGPAERQTVAETNDTGPARTAGASLVRLFEAQAALHGERPAVVFAGRVLGYAELNGRANRLARHLRSLGVGPEALVAICLERSAETVVAMLAALKAGGAFLPLDLLLPRQRLAVLLEDSAARVLVAEERFLELFPRRPEATVCLDRGPDRAAVDAYSAGDLPGEAPAESLAYVLFTSGSTGRPKGVAVERRQLLNYTLGVSERIGFPPAAHFALVSTFAADLGNTMIFPALTSGGCLHVVESALLTDPETLADYSRRHPFACLKIVPSHLAALLGGSARRDFLPAERLVLGGEAASWELIERLRAERPGCAVWNHYGPTETTVGVLAHPVTERHPNAAIVPLGRPLPGSRVHLLDRDLRPVATWVPGELYVGGAGVARGYLGRPDLTAERFVPDPLGLPGGRLYRTGDRARLLPDGTLEFLGRVDDQVKVRGFRVELGEIESLLRTHPAVCEAAVAARQEDGGELRLVAYAVPDRERRPTEAELRGFLSERLPEPMVPAAVVFLAALPLNANGKLDRAALPAPEAVRPELSAAFVAPRTEVERTVAALWQETLGLPRVGIHDSFFDLGGHSLLLVQICGRLRQTFGRELPMIELFKRPTIASLVLLLSDQPACDPPPAAEPRGDGRKESLGRQRELRRRARAADPAAAGEPG